VLTIVALALVAFVAYRTTPPETRRRALTNLIDAAHRLNDFGRKELEPFWTALRQRGVRPYATAALGIFHIVVFLGLLFGKGALSDPATLVGWGASVGPRTTNGEWSRLLTAPFVHDGLLPLLIELAALVQIGWTLESLVGPFAFSATYLTGAIAGGLMMLRLAPLTVDFGSACAVSAYSRCCSQSRSGEPSLARR
jgi:membrane associated rhomboid family serine protease